MAGTVYTIETDFLIIPEARRTKTKVMAVLISPKPFSLTYKWPPSWCALRKSFLCVYAFLDSE